MRCARATLKPYAGKLFVAISKDTAVWSGRTPEQSGSVSGSVDFYKS